VLRLGSEPRGVEGRVLDGEGHGLAGARVWLEDPTYFGLIQGNPAQVETLLGPAQSAGWGYVTTDAEGAFRIEGLLERAYRLRAMDPETLLAATSEPVEAGAREVRIRLPWNAVHETVKGRVVARDGTAMADVSVVAHRSGFSAKDPWGWEHGETVARPEVRTDAEGRFTLRNVAKEGVAILVHGEAILFAKVKLGEETDVDDVRIVVNRRMHLQVELDPPVDRADEVRVLDGEGQPMDVVIMRGESSFVFPKAEVVDGRSQVLSLSEDAKTAVLYKAGVEVARIPIVLRPDEVARVRH
jgi:protocatechuate 3,4-dioxygenase beta subunit